MVVDWVVVCLYISVMIADVRGVGDEGKPQTDYRWAIRDSRQWDANCRTVTEGG
jgi:hypothetical protein